MCHPRTSLATLNQTQERLKNDEGELSVVHRREQNGSTTQRTEETFHYESRVEAREGHREDDRHTTETPFCTVAALAPLKT